MYKLGKTAADCLIIAVVSLLEKAVIDFVLTEKLFEQIVIQTAGFIKSAWNAGEAATEKVTAAELKTILEYAGKTR